MADSSTREKLMDAALDLFSRKGYQATSVDEIAESIGIKGPNIYKYFKGKRGLFEELLSTTDKVYREKMGLSADMASEITDAEGFRHFTMTQIEYTIRDDTARKMRKMFTIEQFRDKELAKMASEYQFSNIVEQYKSIFERLVKIGAMKDGDPEILALECVGPCTVLLQLCDREPERIGYAMEMIRRHTNSFIKTYFKDKA